MRDYATVNSRFWTGETGRQIRKLGLEAQVVAMYLMTCQSSNMIGLYYLPIPTLAYETGIPLEGASKALRSLEEIGFARYDHDNDIVWVVRMVVFQIAERLVPTDKQCKGIQRQLEEHSKSPFYKEFAAMYRAAFHLQVKEDASPSEAPSKEDARGIEAPPKPESIEQEQRTENNEQSTPLPPKGGDKQTPLGNEKKPPSSGMEALSSILGSAAALRVYSKPAASITNRSSREMQAAYQFLEDLHDEFARQYGMSPATKASRGANWEDPFVAWQRCFEHVRIASVESAEGQDTGLQVVLETPRPRDLADGLQKYKAKVAIAMKKAFGREVQLIPRLEAA